MIDGERKELLGFACGKASEKTCCTLVNWCANFLIHLNKLYLGFEFKGKKKKWQRIITPNITAG